MSEDVHAVHDKLVKVLADADSLYLATASADGVPWNAGAFYAVDTGTDPFQLDIVLEEAGTTLRNVRDNPQVAVVIASGDPFAPFLQGAARATVRDATGWDETVAALREQVPRSEPMLAAPIQAVRLSFSRWRVTDVQSGWLPGKNLTPDDIATS